MLVLKKPKAKIKTAIGLDMGLKYLVADSEGNIIQAPKMFRKTEAKLAKQQKVLSRRVKGSNSWMKAKEAVAKNTSKNIKTAKRFSP
ncbi:MAG: hypothetical protein KatS3mg101_0965 [Patescibacteria group bacterium]|nr:MAG: hypothetical protein KatS3mg101_0965 [Patescibacteria group bacterium]